MIEEQEKTLSLTKKDLDNILYWERLFSNFHNGQHIKETDRITKRKIELMFELAR